MELLKPLASLLNNMSRCCIWNGNSYEVPIRLSLPREGLCEVEREAFRRYSSLLGRAFLLGRLGLRRGRHGLSTCLAFGRSGRGRLSGCRRHRDSANMSLGGFKGENLLP